MEESKTLVEQLREMVEKANKYDAFPTIYADGFIGHEVETPGDERELFTTIADRIEEEYISRPRFEDGEPVQFGDEFECDGKTFVVRGISTTEDGLQHMAARGDEGLFTLERGERVKRPKPEVLDADGMPIKLGDVVYFVDNAEAFDVLGVEDDGDENIHIGRKDGTSTDAWVSPGDLTHKQPDTLERIEADAMKKFADYWGCGDVGCSECPAMVDGKKPYERYENTNGCSIAQRLDLLRRQREVLERVQE